MKRTPLRAVSKKRRKENEGHAAIREAVFERDGYQCQLAGFLGAGRCFGPLSPHHVRKSGQGGAYEADNLVSLCAHHNEQLEADADLAQIAEGLGLVKRRSA